MERGVGESNVSLRIQEINGVADTFQGQHLLLYFLEKQRVFHSLVGRVYTEPGGGPIRGATVDLGWGGYFSLATVRKSTNTDSLGRYDITDTLTYTGPCPFQWMQAHAEGYRGLRNIQDLRVGVSCTPTLQTIDIPLEPDAVTLLGG